MEQKEFHSRRACRKMEIKCKKFRILQLLMSQKFAGRKNESYDNLRSGAEILEKYLCGKASRVQQGGNCCLNVRKKHLSLRGKNLYWVPSQPLS